MCGLSDSFLAKFVHRVIERRREGKIRWVRLKAMRSRWYLYYDYGTFTHRREVAEAWVIPGSEEEQRFRDQHTFGEIGDEEEGYVVEERSVWLDPGEEPH